MLVCVCGRGLGGVEMANVCVYSKYVLYVCMHACIGIHVTSHSRFFLFFYFFILYQIVSLYIACFFSSFLFYILHFQEAIKLKPTFSDAYLNLGNVYKVS